LGDATVTLSLKGEKPKFLHFACSECSEVCEHIGAAFSLILEEKLSLGLSAPPPERKPVESLTEEELIRLAVEERAERAKIEKMLLKSMDRNELWTDYTVTNRNSGKSYRVALRGWERGIPTVPVRISGKTPWESANTSCTSLRKPKENSQESEGDALSRPGDCRPHEIRRRERAEGAHSDNLDRQTINLIGPLRNSPVKNVKDLLGRIKKVEENGHEVTIYPDAEEYISRALYLERIRDRIADIRKDPKNHPLRKTLLKTELLPYQLDGIAFAVGVGRAVLADDMGSARPSRGSG